MKTVARWLVIVGLAAMVGCNSAEVKAVRAMPINHIDLSKVRDGTYQGDFAYGGYDYQAEVTVAGHQIKGITVVKNRNTRQAKMAEGVVKRILDQQENDVDAVSGATTTSKALLKAVERALAKGSGS
jgi:uncharacterized protein with FMN-binding domain